MPDIIQRIAMKALIVKNDKVLLLREAKTYADGVHHGKYHLPGGRVEVGEPFEAALRREIKEETGLEVEIGRPFYVGEWRPVIRGVEHQIIGTFFICTPTSDTITLSTEHDDYQWVDPKAPGKLAIMDPEDKVFEAYIATL